MGSSSRARREARRRSHPQRSRSAQATGEVLTRADILALVEVAAVYAAAAPAMARSRIDRLNELSASAPGHELDPCALVVDDLLARIGAAWERGWCPAELVHAVRRRVSPRAAAWTARAIVLQGTQMPVIVHAPPEWQRQLAELSGKHGPVDGPSALLTPAGEAPVDEWLTVLLVMELMRILPRCPALSAPPSQWATPQSYATDAPSLSGRQNRTLTRIRALLAKAESTEFAAEAEAFSVKAHDLMTRHAIDEALLNHQSGVSMEVRSMRVLIHHPYALQKATLLDTIARANRTRAVWFEFGCAMTLVGMPTDVEQTEMLFTSMLVQATKAMTQQGQQSARPGENRSSAFRKAFLSAYAVGIGERLAQASQRASDSYVSDVLPVLRQRAEAVDDECARLFPHTVSGSRRTRYDARGWEAGTAAADGAVMPVGRVAAAQD